MVFQKIETKFQQTVEAYDIKRIFTHSTHKISKVFI